MERPFSLIDFVSWLVVFVFSLSAHEAAHAWVAKKLGDATGYLNGQLTLNPVPHIRREPFGMALMPILTYFTFGWMFGWASVPFSPAWAKQFPRKAATMALAGPAANFLIAIGAWICLQLGLRTGIYQVSDYPTFSQMVVSTLPGPSQWAATLLNIAFSLNLLLGVFNLLPLPPLDGSALPLFFLPSQAADSYNRLIRSPLPSLIGLVVAWQVFPHLYRPIVSWFAMTFG